MVVLYRMKIVDMLDHRVDSEAFSSESTQLWLKDKPLVHLYLESLYLAYCLNGALI